MLPSSAAGPPEETATAEQTQELLADAVEGEARQEGAMKTAEEAFERAQGLATEDKLQEVSAGLAEARQRLRKHSTAREAVGVLTEVSKLVDLTAKPVTSQRVEARSFFLDGSDVAGLVNLEFHGARHAEAKVAGCGPRWGTYVRGTPAGDDWVQVEQGDPCSSPYFLPAKIGKTVEGVAGRGVVRVLFDATDAKFF